MNRRDLLKAFSVGAAMAGFGKLGLARPTVMPKALVFDTFGTVVDWRGSIIEEGKAWRKVKGIDLDWGNFADRWHARYAPAMENVRKGQLAWTELHVLHQRTLHQILI